MTETAPSHEYLNIAQIMKLIMTECDYEGGIRPWADSRGLHPSIIDKFLAGQRGPAPQLLEALGLEKAVVYKRKRQSVGSAPRAKGT